MENCPRNLQTTGSSALTPRGRSSTRATRQVASLILLRIGVVRCVCLAAASPGGVNGIGPEKGTACEVDEAGYVGGPDARLLFAPHTGATEWRASSKLN